MMKKLTLSALTALALSTGGAIAAGEGGHVQDVDFSFEGPFGKFDQMQLQRGLQVYTEVCSACHGMKFVPIRTLADEGGPALPEDQVRAYAAQLSVNDEASNMQLFDYNEGAARPLTANDHFPANNSQNAPDLSLMAKARAGFHGPYGTGINQFLKGIGGPEHIVSILTGYTGEEKVEAGTTYYENTAFSTGWIAMAPPLYGEDVEYADGHSNELHHEAEDVAAFLMWAAEPKMMARKRAGFMAVTFLVLLTSLLYLTNKKLWAPHKGKKTSL
ncbi:ubiquinol-cytochrome c reductase cytochrome c1 subunit [Celeribacter baekdonensis]|uniref:Cytochrome c1 n=1 Tax=Celeribacter baekdonensis TaxID=875171 RepID=A0A1G7L362_9RHOB|nr:cytochrome c1 [Celeribacter baekdonensis]SDF43893.1 ubiquinol-cytochrome c reductase cytochrome c1 subunit [Celeribacter baekdonensis]